MYSATTRARPDRGGAARQVGSRPLSRVLMNQPKQKQHLSEPEHDRRVPSERLARLRQCWEVDGDGWLPGLLPEWRRTNERFQDRVVRPVH